MDDAGRDPPGTLLVPFSSSYGEAGEGGGRVPAGTTDESCDDLFTTRHRDEMDTPGERKGPNARENWYKLVWCKEIDRSQLTLLRQ